MVFNHKRADFWLPNFEFKRSLLSLPDFEMRLVQIVLIDICRENFQSGHEIDRIIVRCLICQLSFLAYPRLTGILNLGLFQY